MMMHHSSQEYGKYAAHGYPSSAMTIPSAFSPFGVHVHPPNATAGQWSTNLCHCFDDPANCLITCFCPCVTFGQIAEIVDQGQTSCVASGAVYAVLAGVTGLACLYSCFYRSRMRGHYDLEEAPCVDCLIHFCCETCALCQEYRELKNRGFDMGIGWEANVNRQDRGVAIAPIPASMSR